MLVYDPATLAEMHAICRRHGVLFIADEVMTGWGRTGTLLACEQAGIVPDLLCLAKGITGGSMPLAVTLASEAIYDAHWSTDRTKTFYHSSSYTANPIACAAAIANLGVWRDEPVVGRIAALVERQRAGLSKLAQLRGVANPRQCGTVIAVDYAIGGAGYLAEVGPKLLAFFRERDLLVRPLGNTAYVMPPYCIEDHDLTKVHKAMAEAAGLLG
jgi:adenosylmethionine-8-amino-7-oxononanoate aminotransferase